MKTIKVLAFSSLISISGLAAAENINAEFFALTATGTGKPIGTATFMDGEKGLSVKYDLSGLTPGEHGIHVHQNANCGPGEKDGKTVPGLAAGGHYDPQNAGRHEGPKGKGHLGDLPALNVNKDGKAKNSAVAPRLKVKDIKGRAIIIHAGGDNYSDKPKQLGGGGARVACAVIK